MRGITFADVSRWQERVDWAAYSAAAGTTDDWGLTRADAAVCKATGGTETSGGTSRVDPWFARNQAGMREHLSVRGYYHFLQVDADPVAQARFFAETIGPLQPGEFAVLDVEQDADADAHERFCAETDRLVGGRCWVYGGAQVRTDRPVWIARYFDHTPNPDAEPDLPHALWQFTDRGHVPGVTGGCDVNVHRGDLASLRRLTVQDTEDDMPYTEEQIKKMVVEGVREALRPAMREGTSSGPDALGDTLDAVRRNAARLNDIQDTLKDGDNGGGREIDYKKLAKEVAPLLAADLARRLSNG